MPRLPVKNPLSLQHRSQVSPHATRNPVVCTIATIARHTLVEVSQRCCIPKAGMKLWLVTSAQERSLDEEEMIGKNHLGVEAPPYPKSRPPSYVDFLTLIVSYFSTSTG